MDLTSFGFVGLVIVLGGVIAFWADRLGRYLGKKRLSIFGMRPRHTAAFLTITAGVLTPLVTVLIVVAASQDVRLWLVEGRQAVEQVKGLRVQVSDLEDSRKTLDGQIVAKTAQVGYLDTRLKAAQADLVRYRAEAARSAQLARVAEQKLSALTRRAEQLTASLRERTAALTKTTTDLSTEQGKVATTRQEYVRLRNSFDKLTKEIDDAYKENKRLDDENERLSKDADRLKIEIASLTADKETLAAEQGRLSSDLTETQRQLERGKLELDSLRSQLSTASNLLLQNLNVSRTMPLIFRMGQELVRLSLPSGLDRDASRTSLTSLLRSARILADSAGARGDPSAGIWYRDTAERVITVEEQEQAIVAAITGQKDNLVLVATSMLNAFQGEFVALEIKAYRNPVVYRAGQVILETRINGTETEDRILQQINEFVQTGVRKQAIDDKMIPVQGDVASLGEVSQEDVLNLMREIKGASRVVRVLAVALQDTRAADPLKLEFRLR